MNSKLSPEEKLLRAILDDQKRDRNYPVRQEYFCDRCKLSIDILDPNIEADYRDVEIGGKTFTVAIPRCPVCYRLVEPQLYINH